MGPWHIVQVAWVWHIVQESVEAWVWDPDTDTGAWVWDPGTLCMSQWRPGYGTLAHCAGVSGGLGMGPDTLYRRPLISVSPLQAFGVFGLCQIHAFVDYIRSKLSQQQFEFLFKTMVLLTAVVAAVVGGALTALGSILHFEPLSLC